MVLQILYVNHSLVTIVTFFYSNLKKKHKMRWLIHIQTFAKKLSLNSKYIVWRAVNVSGAKHTPFDLFFLMSLRCYLLHH